MKTVPATQLKNRLGAVLRQATLGPVAIERHGRVVAWLVPASAVNTDAQTTSTPPATRSASKSASVRPTRFGRTEEERLLKLCASGDLRPSRWRRAGDATMVAGIAAILASVPGFDSTRLLALAEQLHPGMSRAENFSMWLSTTPLRLDRFLPQLARRMQAE